MVGIRSSRASRIGLVIFVATVYSSCSFSVPFLLANRTDAEITVMYTLKEKYGGQVVPTLESTFGEPDPFASERIKVDFENGTVEVRLMAGETMLIDRPSDRVIERPDEYFNLRSLRIIGKTHTLSLEGKDVFDRFLPIKRSAFSYGPKYKRYVLEYAG